MANHFTSRVLAVLELLQTHGQLSGAALAHRLSVDRRTVRRYIAVLEEMGIPITTDRGPQGGYALVAGYRLPPMMFTNDEAVAISLGLVAVRGFGLNTATQSVAGAQAKLERVMPASARQRMRSISDSVAYPTKDTNLGNTAFFAILSSSAHARQVVRLTHVSPSGTISERDFDPYGMGFWSSHWYVVGYCHIRSGLRSFRLDRLQNVLAQDRRFERPAQFDVLEHLVLSIANLPRKFAIRVRLETDLESARRELFAAIGVLEPAGSSVILRSQADDLDWFARELARLPWPFHVEEPDELTTAVARHGQSLWAQHGAQRLKRARG